MTADTSIYLSITADSHADLVTKISELYHGFCSPASVVSGDVEPEQTLGAMGDASPGDPANLSELLKQEGPKQQRRRGRPRKNETQEAAALAPATESVASAPEPAAAAQPAPALEGSAGRETSTEAADPLAIPNFLDRAKAENVEQQEKVTKEQVKNALNAYVGAHSMPAGRELVQKVCGVDVLSLSQIPEDKYAAVVAACKVA